VLTHTGEPEEIAAKCLALFANTQRANSIGAAGRQFAQRHFDIKQQAARLEQAYQAACSNFDATIAATVWQTPVQNATVDLMLARKLGLMADSSNAVTSVSVQSLLQEHARLMESKQARVLGLETAIANLNQHLVNAQQVLAEKDAQIAAVQEDANALRASASWRITSPLRRIGNKLGSDSS
jgi:hypothetical protein